MNPDYVQTFVLRAVRAQDKGRGAAWEDLVRVAARWNISERDVEAAINELLDNGSVWEPVLSILKVS